MQVYKLGKELGYDTKDFLKKLTELGIEDMKPMSILSEENIANIREALEVKKEKKKGSVSWRPSSILGIPTHLKDPNYRYRWCDKDKLGNIRKKESEGWEIDKVLSRKMTSLNTTINDGSPLDGATTMRELIVMKMPVEMAEARNKYYEDRANGSMEEMNEQFKRDTGGKGYGEIVLSQ